MPRLLLEIGCEELPASWVASLTQQLKDRFAEAMAREQLAATDIVAHGGSRRLCVLATVDALQPDREERAWGPAVRSARDAAGAWTPAALGFAKKQGVAPEAFVEGTKEGGKEPQLFVAKTIAGRPAARILPAVIAATLRGLAFPKRMSWDAWLDDGKGAFQFGRPIRWVVAMLGSEVVPFEIFTLVAGGKGERLVVSGNETRGHRFLPRGKAGGPIALAQADDLIPALRQAFVLVEAEARTAAIRSGLQSKGAAAEAFDHPLIEEWRDLVEWPTIMAGDVPAEFRPLPVDVLETVLVHHQKYIPLLEGGTVARFAAITNTDPSAEAEVVRGMQRVVVARLRDAAFFLGEDRKRPLAERFDDLSGVTFHQGLGTYRDKAARLERLVAGMAEDGLLAGDAATWARDAARLAKADLTTLMVREFTELQGVMGGIYLRDHAAPEPVAAAVQWHYHPTSLDAGSAPAGRLDAQAQSVFAAVSLADKLDTLAGYLGLGLVPSGSSDPYGLRRAGQGAIRVVLEFWDPATRPSLRALFARAVAGYAGSLKRPAADVQRDGEAFLLDRLRHVLLSRGVSADEADAALGAHDPTALDDPLEAQQRAAALRRVRSEAREDFEALAIAFKRARNILDKGGAGSVDPSLFEDDAERELHRALGSVAGSGGYEARLRSLATLRAPVDRFFDDVMVMAEDGRVRANRLGLLAAVLEPFMRIADISKLAPR